MAGNESQRWENHHVRQDDGERALPRSPRDQGFRVVVASSGISPGHLVRLGGPTESARGCWRHLDVGVREYNRRIGELVEGSGDPAGSHPVLAPIPGIGPVTAASPVVWTDGSGATASRQAAAFQWDTVNSAFAWKRMCRLCPGKRQERIFLPGAA